jgi:sulfonate transport system permease protein
MGVQSLLLPNEKVNERVSLILTGGWVLFILAFWWGVLPHASALIPTPPEVAKAGLIQWNQGAVIVADSNGIHAGQLIISIFTSLSAIFFALLLGLSLAYLSTIPLFKAPVRFIGSARVLSLTGMTFIFVLATPNGYWLKVSVLIFAIVVFFINAMLQVIEDIPQGRFDHARTLGMNHWEVLREVVIRGTLASAFDTLRMNAAMAWMMLTMVESMSRSGGGIGIVLVELARTANYAAIFSVQLMIFVVGIAQDKLVQFAKLAACPYTKGQ